MASCLLCTEEHRRGNYLTQELNNGFTVENAIRQYFTSQQVNFNFNFFSLAKLNFLI